MGMDSGYPSCHNLIYYSFPRNAWIKLDYSKKSIYYVKLGSTIFCFNHTEQRQVLNQIKGGLKKYSCISRDSYMSKAKNIQYIYIHITLRTDSPPPPYSSSVGSTLPTSLRSVCSTYCTTCPSV